VCALFVFHISSSLKLFICFVFVFSFLSNCNKLQHIILSPVSSICPSGIVSLASVLLSPCLLSLSSPLSPLFILLVSCS
jgi:hypothetical protein